MTDPLTPETDHPNSFSHEDKTSTSTTGALGKYLGEMEKENQPPEAPTAYLTPATESLTVQHDFENNHSGPPSQEAAAPPNPTADPQLQLPQSRYRGVSLFPVPRKQPHIFDAPHFRYKAAGIEERYRLVQWMDSVRRPDAARLQKSSERYHSSAAKWNMSLYDPKGARQAYDARKSADKKPKTASPIAGLRPLSSRRTTKRPFVADEPTATVTVAPYSAQPEERPMKRVKKESPYAPPLTVAKPKPKSKKRENKPTRQPKGTRDVRLNSKETLLSKIKNFMNSRTDPYPNPKSRFQQFEDAQLPELGQLIDSIPVAKYDKDHDKAGPLAGDPTGLHRAEQEMARALKITFDEYRCQKRRIFLGFAIFQRLVQKLQHEDKSMTNSFGKTQTQAVGNVDVNKLSNFYTNFSNWGWLDIRHFDEDYLDQVVAKFQDYEAKGKAGTSTAGGV